MYIGSGCGIFRYHDRCYNYKIQILGVVMGDEQKKFTGVKFDPRLSVTELVIRDNVVVGLESWHSIDGKMRHLLQEVQDDVLVFYVDGVKQGPS